MASITVALSDSMKDWVDEQARTGRYEDAAAYVRALIGKDEERQAKIAGMQRALDEGLASGISTRTRAEILADARAQAGVDPRDL